MAEPTIVAGIIVDENTTISFVDICQRCNISEEFLIDMIEHGLLHAPMKQLKNASVDQKTFSRIQSASRLQQDLDINASGVVLVMELLDELEQVRKELSILQHHLKEF